MASFKISGDYYRRGGANPFSKTLDAKDEKEAREKVFCLMGSNHKIRRTEIDIKKIESA